MKKAILIFAILASAMSLQAQNVTTDAQGNYVAVDTTGAKLNGKTFKDAKGIIYPVYVSVRGKEFVKKISKTTGNAYNSYLKLKVNN